MSLILSDGISLPLVSVVMATYRQDESLEKAIRSVMTQSYGNIELVIVDDNADPFWNSKVRDMISAVDSPSIHLFVNDENMGSAGTRNRGIDEAEGEYITFLDDDDLYMPDKIRHQVEMMIACSADYSITNLDNYYDTGKLCNYTRRTYLENCSEEDLLGLHFVHHMTCTDTMMFRASYLKKIGGFCGIDFGDEFFLMSEAILGGGRFCYVSESDVETFVHENETGISTGENKLRGEGKLYEYKKKYFPRLSLKMRRGVRMRHYAALTYAYMRLRRYFMACCTAFMSFLSAPVEMMRLVCDKKFSEKKYRGSVPERMKG